MEVTGKSRRYVTRRRVIKLLLPIITTIGMLIGSVGIASATQSYVTAPWAGACDFHADWEGSSTNTKFAIAAYESNHNEQCSVFYQAIWLCGIYGQGNTYYYEGTQQVSEVGIGPFVGWEGGWYGTGPGGACTHYGSDIILNWWIVVSAGPWANTCFNRNAISWAGGANGPGGVCQFS